MCSTKTKDGPPLDEDTVSTVRVEIWKENIFFIFYHFVELSFIFCFHFVTFSTPPSHVFKQKSLSQLHCLWYLIKWSRIRLKKHEDIDICHQKIINFSTKTTKIRKKIRLAAGPLPAVALSGEQPPAARCAGAKMRKILSKFWVFLFPFSDDLAPL